MTKQMTLSQWKKLIETTRAGLGYTPAQIRKISGQNTTMQRVDDSVFKLEAEKLEAIKQQNSKGLQVFDITPANVFREEAFCAYDGETLQKLVGIENVNNVSLAGAGDLYYDNQTGVVDGRAVVAPYWRTVFVPYAGNFLKVEYLPSQIGADGGDLSVNVSGGANRLQNNSEPKNTSESNVYDFYAPFSPTYYNANKASSDRIILLDFNTPTNNPIIAKHGERFKTYFSGFYITFKQNSPRIRVTIGQNAEVSTVDDRPVALHLWKGHGVLNDSFVNPVPYSISHADFNAGSLSGISMTGSLIKEFCLVANPTAQNLWEQNGLGLLWINTLYFNYLFNDATAVQKAVSFSLYVKSLGTAASSFVTGSVKIKRLFERTVIFNESRNYSAPDISLPEPLRVSLRKDTGLFLRVQITFGDATQNQSVYFGVEGYSLGPLQGYLRGAVNPTQGPFFNRYKLVDSPYPTDLDDYQMPMA